MINPGSCKNNHIANDFTNCVSVVPNALLIIRVKMKVIKANAMIKAGANFMSLFPKVITISHVSNM